MCPRTGRETITSEVTVDVEKVMRIFLLQAVRSERTRKSRESVIAGAEDYFRRAHGEPSNPTLAIQVLENLLFKGEVVERNGIFQDNLPTQGLED